MRVAHHVEAPRNLSVDADAEVVLELRQLRLLRAQRRQGARLCCFMPGNGLMGNVTGCRELGTKIAREKGWRTEDAK